MCTTTKNAPIALIIALVLVVSMAFPFGPLTRPAQADDLSDAKATLDAASKQLEALTAEYNSLQQEVSALDAEIADTTQKVQAAQTEMLKGQDALGGTVLAAYKNEDSVSLINVFLASDDIGQFMKNLNYYTAIQEDQAQQVAQQKELRNTFTVALEDLDVKRDQQQVVLDQAQAKRAEAEKVVSDASAKVSSIESERARLAELAAQAAAFEEQKKQEAEISSDWNTSNSGGSSNSGSNSGNSGGEDLGSGWKTGIASAYGGSTDPYTPNPGTTATGAVCDDWSMGVAVPMAWPNYRSYLGRAVEIRYNGKTVVATVNDCGYMGGGSRSLDLQPGVFKAFGFQSCNSWGLRTVSYRFL